MKKRKFAEGGATALDELASGRDKGTFDQDVYARAKRFVERGEEAPTAKTTAKPAAKSAAKSAAKPAAKPAEKIPERPRGESVADEPAPTRRAAPAETSKASNVPDERARMGARFGSAEQRAKYSKDQMVPQESIDTAKAAAAARAAKIRKQDEDFSSARTNMFKRLGTQGMRDEAKAEGYAKGGKVKCYAKGGSVRGGGCESKGKTKGRMV